MSGDVQSTVLACAVERWLPRMGDPTVMGWLTVAAYGICAVTALHLVRHAPFPPVTRRRERLFWTMLGILMAFLAVNEQLDLHSFVTDLGRCIARQQGWYESRRIVQREFILVLLIAAGLVLLAFGWLLRGAVLRNWPALLGLMIVGGVVLLRAVSFHHVDTVIYVPVLFGERLHEFVVLAGLGLIFWAARRQLRRAWR